MKTADATIERLMQHYGDLQLAGLETQRDELARLRRAIAQLVVEGDSRVECLAQSLGWSVRTLQRRLAARGLNYSDLLGEVRKTMALNLLENPSPWHRPDRLLSRLLRGEHLQSRLSTLGGTTAP